MNNGSKWKLATLIFSAMIFNACGSHNDNSKDVEKESEQQKQEQIDENKELEQKKAYYNHVFDSVAQTNHYNEYCKERDSLPNILTIEHNISLGGVMERKVFEQGKAIFMNDILLNLCEYFSKYNINLSNDNTIRNAVDIEALCYIGIEHPQTHEKMVNDMENLKRELYFIIDNSKYGTPHKNAMKSKVDYILKNGEQKLIDSRKQIEKSFEKYYLTTERVSLGVKLAGEGSRYNGGYDCGYEWYFLGKHKYKIECRSISVYDQNLQVDFFGDADAIYKLIDLGNGKWQVTKKTKNGKTEKTKIFTDNSKWNTWQYLSNDKQSNEFGYEPGVNMGVRINVSDYKIVEQRKQEWQISDVDRKRIDSIKYQQKHLDSITNIRYKQAQQVAENEFVKKYGRPYQGKGCR